MDYNMMFKKIFILTFFTLAMVWAAPASAYDCTRIKGTADQTVCSSPQLLWLDSVYNEDFYTQVKQDPQHAQRLIAPMDHAAGACSSEGCLRGAYLYMLGVLHGTGQDFDWEGTWWNASAAHGNNGKLLIGKLSGWEFRMDASVQAGVYQTALRGDVRLYSGVGFTDSIAWGGDCTVVLIPLHDGKIKVRSDSKNSCKLLMPGGMTIDGDYVKSDHDPRPSATLLSLGILPDQQTDEKFRQLVGKDYQKYVDTATAFNHEKDLDDLGAKVVTMWMKGRADRQAAMIMTTPQGKIWALRVDPEEGNKVSQHYVTTEQDKKTLPNTLANWQARFNLP